MSDEKELTKLDCGGCPVPRFQHEHDCGFPDCIGGWQNAFKLSANRCEELQQQLTAARERIEDLEEELLYKCSCECDGNGRNIECPHHKGMRERAEQLQAENREFAEALMTKAGLPCRCVDRYPHTFGYSEDCKYYGTIQKAKERCK